MKPSGIKKAVKDVMDADEKRNKIKHRINGVFARNTPIFVPQRLAASKRIGLRRDARFVKTRRTANALHEPESVHLARNGLRE